MENILFKKKKEYKGTAILITVLLVIALLVSKNNLNLETKTFVLSEKPKFKESKTVKTANYWIELNFTNSEKVYRISDIEYKYIDKEKFISEVNENDTVQIAF